MKTTDPDGMNSIHQLLQHLFLTGGAVEGVPGDLLTEIAESRNLIEQLALLSTLVTGEKSTLKTQTDLLLTCQECQEALPAYVEAQIKGIAAGLRYSQIHAHLETCADCREEAALLYELERNDANSLVPTAPSYQSFAEWHTRRAGAEQEKQIGSILPTLLWQQVKAQVRRLIEPIEIRIAGAKAIFGDMATVLAPQLAPVSTFRSGAATDETTELLELPSPETNHLLKVRLGPVRSGTATLILEVKTLQPPIPLTEAKVDLRDEDGNLLERVTSDKDGLALFHALDIGKYQVEVIIPEQTWQLTVNLRILS